MPVIEYPEISEVYHVTHINNSFNIFDSEVIKADFIRDESILKTNNIKVNWLSPNHWTIGYRYGNVRFKFDFLKLIHNKNIYFIETINYHPIAHRFLITKKNYNFETINDFINRSPRHEIFKNEKGNFSRRGNDNLEFMIEEDLNIEDCSNIDFVLHHNNRCCIDPRKCLDKGFHEFQARPLVLAYLLSKDNFKSDLFDEDDIIDGFNTLIRKARKCNFTNSVSDLKTETIILDQALGLYSERNVDGYIEKLSTFKCIESIEHLIAKKILNSFSINITANQ